MAADQATGPRRAYRSPRREQQAAETRAMVASAAARLFGERGWAATGMREVARAAGVSVETVYASFRSKGDLLLAAIDVAVVGDVAPVPLDQRPEFAALGSGTRRQRARATASLVAGINQRTAGVVLALREAGASDAELAERRREREQRRRINVEQGAALVAGRAVTAEEVDGLWALVAVEVYQMLTELRGWTPQQYENWLADVIERLLPGPDQRDLRPDGIERGGHDYGETARRAHMPGRGDRRRAGRIGTPDRLAHHPHPAVRGQQRLAHHPGAGRCRNPDRPDLRGDQVPALVGVDRGPGHPSA